MKIIRKISENLSRHPNLAFFLRYFGLFTMLLFALASKALYNIIATETNPFFYANF